jgi:hypothetical protein
MNRFLLTTTLCGTLFVTMPSALRADTITVTNTASFGPGTLDDAIGNANDGDTIVFDVPLPATIVIQEGPEELSSAVTIAGPGADKLTVSGDGTNQIFFVDDDTAVTISGMTISNGVSTGSIDDDYGGGGGAIVNGGTLTISGCALKNNVAQGGDGQTPGGGGGAGGGGAILNGPIDPFTSAPATLYVVNSTFSGNQAIGGAGDQAGGGGGGGFGGAIFNANGTVTATNCTFAANIAVGGTSGIANDTNSDDSGSGDGGVGLDNPNYDGAGSSGNGDGSAGGAGDDGGGGGAGSNGEQDSGVCNGGTGGTGGMGGFGGGGGAGGPGADGCVTNAPATGGNGGDGGNGGVGGFGGGGGGGGIGGQPTGVGTLTGSVGIPGTNGLGAASGVSTNGGAGGGFGGAIFNYALGTTLLFNCTVASNTAAGGTSAHHLADGQGTAGGIYNFEGFVGDLSEDLTGTVQIVDTIIATNMATPAPDVGGAITSGGNNLIGVADGSAGFVNGSNGDLVGSATHPLNAELGPLADNGGTTFTIALLSTSPAINAGNDPDCPSTDQRGVTRPQIVHCDIGAFEFNDRPPTALCKNVTVAAVTNCVADASIDDGSFDPDPGDTVTLTQSPPGPYSLGITTVTLTATDHHGETNSCTATVTVIDSAPTIACPTNPIVFLAESPSGVVAYFANPSTSDGCPFTVSCTPRSGSTFPIGDTVVTCVATDTDGHTNSCTFTVHVKSASEQLDDLASVVEGFGLKRSIQNSIVHKLQAIARLVDKDHSTPACRQLQALMLQAERDLANEHLTEDQTIQITTPLVRLLTVLGCE